MPEQLIDALWTTATAVGVMMLAVWIVSVRLNDASIVDLIWGAGFVLIAWVARSATGSEQWLLPGLTTIWGLRLSTYLAWRNHGKPEDFRYQAMRSHHGRDFRWVSLVTVFGLQGVIMWIVSLPLQAGMISGPVDWPLLRVTGLLLWCVGFFFEAVGDWQLARFRAEPSNKGKVLDSGLWCWTRHPNYFGDFLIWWGLYLVSVSTCGIWWTVIGPVVMSYFLMRVSGVTMLERSLKKTKPHYRDYIERTNAFFPWRPHPKQQHTGDQ